MSKTAYKKKIKELINTEEPQLSFGLKSDSTKISKSLNGKKILNVLSLFSGCGGMDLGFEGGFSVFSASINEYLSPDFVDKVINKNEVLLTKNRFKTVFANDILPDARKAWINYFTKNKGASPETFYTESIVDLVKMHKAGLDVFPKNVDVVTGGFPCQDFSIAGKRNGFESHKDHNGEIIKTKVASEETRGQLYMWMKQVVEITEPNIFIAENVKGLVNLANVKEIIQNDFSSANGEGYLVLNPQVLHSADYGVPQSRERVIFIGIKKSALKKSVLLALESENIPKEFNPYPQPTHAYTVEGDNLKEPVKLAEIFKDLKEPDVANDPSQMYYSKAKFMGKHCQGQTEIRLQGIAPTIRAEHHGNIEFRRLSEKNGGKHFKELERGLVERRLTPRECGLIQTFPRNYDFVIDSFDVKKSRFLISPSQAYKIIGNAVPPLLAYHIAKRLEHLWDIYFKK